MQRKPPSPIQLQNKQHMFTSFQKEITSKSVHSNNEENKTTILAVSREYFKQALKLKPCVQEVIC